MKRVFLSLGSNMGDRERNFARAIRHINFGIGQIVDLSGVYETEPWGFDADNKFLNMIVEIVTDLSAQEVLLIALEIEEKLGRIRNDTVGYSSRTLDLDILFYGNKIISDDNLIVPHPHIQNRKFILAPLAEIAPKFVHPTIGMSIQELYDTCSDASEVVQLGFLSDEN